jgi:RND family efflux transporter MFP subunit
MTTPTENPGFWRKIFFAIKFLEIRLRFVMILVVTALVVGYWDHIQNYYERWQRESGAEQATDQAGAVHSEFEYFCGMHPFVVRDAPGKCPVCGMDLVQRKKGAAVTLPEGVLARVQVSPDRVMQAGVQIEPVMYRLLTRVVRSYGIVEAAETHEADVIARFPGRVEELMVNATGMPIRKGEPLARIYSPEFLQGSQEYARALANQKSVNANASATAVMKERAQEFVESAKKRLSLAGFTDQQLNAIAEKGGDVDSITLYSPVSGTIMKKNVVVGQSVEEGTAIFSIADLSSLWVQVEVIESKIGAVHSGMPVEVSSVAWPGQIFYGTVDFFYPEVDPESRSLKVRVAIDNADAKLRPGMYVNAVMRSPMGQYGADMGKAKSAPSSGATVAPVPTQFPTKTLEAASAYLSTLADGATYYMCPMDPEVVSDKAGECPLCNMKLREKRKGQDAETKSKNLPMSLPTKTKEDAAKYLATLPEGTPYFICTMDPEVVSGAPGDCPICGMHLVERKKTAGVQIAGAMPADLKLPTESPVDAARFLAALPEGSDYYTCPMHAEVVSDKQSDCPKCNMALEKRSKSGIIASADVDAGAFEEWAEGYTCPMHPDELSDKPGICTSCACGMNMTKWRVQRVLSIPESAVIDTGQRKVVYIETSPGVYDSRAVALGHSSGAYYAVIDGLTLGQRIVSRGSFLIDAEARLNPVQATTSAPANGATTAPAGHQHAG